MTEEPIEAPRRGRPPRQAAEQEQRRRRQPGSLNRMVYSPLAIPEECKDPDYHYHWVNDERGRVQMLSTQDDYDVVSAEDLKETARRNRADGIFDSRPYDGNGDTVSTVVERGGMRAVLMRKREAFYKADYEEGLEQRQAMMEGRVYEGVLDNDAGSERREAQDPTTYVPKGNLLPQMRRKGPVSTRRL